MYARYGVRYARESAAGPIGTGMLLGMLGLAIVWLAQLPFTVAALWWERRHDVSEVGYLECVFGDWLALGGTFVAVCLALLVVMALARWLGVVVVDPGRRRLRRRSSRCSCSSARTSSPTSSPSDDPELGATYERYERAQGVDGIPLRIEEVSGDTSQANAYAFGHRAVRRGSCSGTRCSTAGSRDGEVDVVLAHELGHHSSNHIPEAIGWFALFALPGDVRC